MAHFPESVLDKSAVVVVVPNEPPVLLPGMVAQTRAQTATCLAGLHAADRERDGQERENWPNCPLTGAYSASYSSP